MWYNTAPWKFKLITHLHLSPYKRRVLKQSFVYVCPSRAWIHQSMAQGKKCAIAEFSKLSNRSSIIFAGSRCALLFEPSVTTKFKFQLPPRMQEFKLVIILKMFVIFTVRWGRHCCVNKMNDGMLYDILWRVSGLLNSSCFRFRACSGIN
jgi:hypothetical protein